MMIDVSPLCPASASRAHVWLPVEQVQYPNGSLYSRTTCSNCGIVSNIKIK